MLRSWVPRFPPRQGTDAASFMHPVMLSFTWRHPLAGFCSICSRGSPLASSPPSATTILWLLFLLEPGGSNTEPAPHPHDKCPRREQRQQKAQPGAEFTAMTGEKLPRF